uniref:Uncharacterized protein n=1 Tax=Triticum urartu TaxID=4572 RepID=A0A8R7UA51_TRIUA
WPTPVIRAHYTTGLPQLLLSFAPYLLAARHAGGLAPAARPEPPLASPVPRRLPADGRRRCSKHPTP